MSLPYFLNGIDPYQPSNFKSRLQPLDWYGICSLYRQSFLLDNQTTTVYKQVLVQQFSPKPIDNTRNSWLIEITPVLRKFAYQVTTISTLPNS